MVSDQSSTWLVTHTTRHSHQQQQQTPASRHHWKWQLVRIGIPLVVVWGFLGVYVPVLLEEMSYQARLTSQNLHSVFPQGLKTLVFPAWSLTALPPELASYALVIPKLGIQEPIVEGVDASDKSRYMEALRHGVAHAAGTGSPGQRGVGYYFAHSSGLPFWGGRTATFATLHKLAPADEVIVYKDRQPYHYSVINTQIVNPSDVRLLTSDGTEERLVLQTCWPLGTDWQRLLVVAERKQ